MTLPVWAKGLIALAIVLALSALGYGIHHVIYMSGFDDAKAKADIKALATSVKNSMAMDAASKESLEREKKLLADLNALSLKSYEEQENAKKSRDFLLADVRNGAIKLSIATRRCSVYPGPTGSSTGIAAAPGQEERAELMPEAAIALIDIAADGDTAMRDRNELIDRYNAVRDTCSRQLTTPAPQ